MVIISLMILIITIAFTSSIPTNSISNSHDNNIIETNRIQGNTIEGLSPILIARLTTIIFLISGALAYNALYIQSIGSGLSLYSGLFQVTVLSQSFDLFLFILAAILLLPWNVTNKFKSPLLLGSNGKPTLISYLSGPLVKEYSLILLFSILGSSLLLSSGNLLSMYLSLELQSFGVYILATIYKDSESSTNAGLKYFLLGGLSSCFILFGCVLIYSYTGLIYFEDIYSITNVLSSISISDTNFNFQNLTDNNLINIPMIIQLGFIFIFVGFLFKIAAAPFHNWAPDVYNDVPTIVTSWLTVMPKIAILVLSLDILTTLNISNGTGSILSFIPNLLLISSFLSLIIGTIVGLAQIKIKRLLAYSTISHVGFLLIGLSLSSEDSMEALLFYLIQYSLTNLNTFLILLSFGYILYSNKIGINKKGNNKDIDLISELKGQFQINPLLSLSLSICLFSMAGIPPLAGFFAKAQILSASILNGSYFISIIAIIVSVISAYYYLQIIKIMHFDELDSNLTENSSTIPQDVLVVSHSHSYLISLLTISITLFMLKPSIALNSLSLLATSTFFNG